MTSIFDGMASVLNDVFGAEVVHQPDGGEPRTINAIFRREPLPVVDDDGRDILALAPIVKVLSNDAAGFSRGDRVQPGDGNTYIVGARSPIGSNPASDAFVAFDLELVE